MKTTNLLFAFALGLLRTQMIPAQGTIYVSNLGRISTTDGAIGSDSWFAQGFGTGTNAGGYVLNAVQLLMSAATGNPNGFDISIYSRSGNSPQSNLGNLTGSNPVAGGVHSYTASGLTLSPSTAYYVVVTAATPVGLGAYNWAATSGPAPLGSDGWGGGIYDFSTDGSNWNYLRDHFFQFAIYATAVPEPSASVLMGMGLVGLSFCRSNNRQAKYSA